jgi:hypothetical protein
MNTPQKIELSPTLESGMDIMQNYLHLGKPKNGFQVCLLATHTPFPNPANYSTVGYDPEFWC